MSVVTSAVLPGHVSEHTGRPSPSITTARIICRGPAGDPCCSQCCPSVCPPAPSKYRLVVSIEHQVEAGEQIAAVIEQSLLDHILQAARRRWRAAVLLLGRQFFAQPRPSPR